MNLLRNAVEHGGEDVTVIIGALDDGFLLEDDGSGLPDTGLSELFDESSSAPEERIGLGLRIVKQVADAHRWEIIATDGIDGGARFQIIGAEFGVV